MSEKFFNLESSTRLSQVMSRIHLLGLGGQAFRSSEAPPKGERKKRENKKNYKNENIQDTLYFQYLIPISYKIITL